MLRVLVALQLFVATLAGPRPCLCPASVAPATAPAASVPSPGLPGACGCCALSGSFGGADDRASATDHPEPPIGPCECQIGKQDPAATTGEGRAWSPGADPTDPDVWQLVPALVGPVTGVVSDSAPRRDGPFCSTADLLYAFHRLRC